MGGSIFRQKNWDMKWENNKYFQFLFCNCKVDLRYLESHVWFCVYEDDLAPSRSLVSSFTPIRLWQPKILFSVGLTNFMIFDLKPLSISEFRMFESNLFYLVRGHSFSTYTKLRKTNSLIHRRRYQELRNVSFSENFAYVLNE